MYFKQSSKEEHAKNVTRAMEEVRQKSENTKWVKERIMRQNALIKTENARQRKRKERERKKQTEIRQRLRSPGGRKVCPDFVL